MPLPSNPALPSMVFRSFGAIVVLAVVIVALAACQSSDTDDSMTSAVNQANQAAQNAAVAAQDNTAMAAAEESKFAAKDAATAAMVAADAAAEAVVFASSSSMKEEPGRLVVYSGRSESLVAPIIEQFAEATGIDVQVKYGSTFAMAATLLEEGSNSPAAVFFAQDPGGLGAVSAMLSPLPADVVLKVPAWARSPEGSWVGISGRARVIVYSTELVSEEELPTSVKDLTDPKWKGRIGWPPGNASFRTMVTAMRLMWGEDANSQLGWPSSNSRPSVSSVDTRIAVARPPLS